jgi:hypothetical protein
MIPLFLSLLAHADVPKQDCAFQFAQAKGALVAPEQRDDAKKLLTQTKRLKTGETAVFRLGGCEHVSFTFEFEGATFKRNKVANAFTAARKLLRETPVTKDDDKKKLLLSALEKGAAKVETEAPGRYKLPCGDARCSLDVRLHKLISISYDLAL